jgi:hypothetical protein
MQVLIRRTGTEVRLNKTECRKLDDAIEILGAIMRHGEIDAAGHAKIARDSIREVYAYIDTPEDAEEEVAAE